MHAAADLDDRLAFAPPQPPGMLRAFVLAVIAHLLLLLALTYGLHWQRETPVATAEAELWSALPVEAAPKVEPAPPPPPPPPAPPVVRAPPLPDPQVQRDAEIALEREREKREAAQRHQAELEKERDRKRKLEARRKLEEELALREQERLDKLARQEKLAKQEKLERQQEQARLQAEARRKDDEKKRRLQEQQDKKLAQLREENVKRSLAMAGTGAPSATGNGARASGPSASWAGRVVARVRPNIVFSDDVSGNPKAEVEVRTSPDGTIVGKRLVHSSGSRAWDDAVLRALDKTESLPRDIDGRVPSPVVIEFRPKG